MPRRRAAASAPCSPAASPAHPAAPGRALTGAPRPHRPADGASADRMRRIGPIRRCRPRRGSASIGVMTESSAAHRGRGIRPPVPARTAGEAADPSGSRPPGSSCSASCRSLAGAFRLTELTSGGDGHRRERALLRLAGPGDRAHHRLERVPPARRAAVRAVAAPPTLAPDRRARSLAPAGLLSALSALWMTLFYEMPATQRRRRSFVMRLGFGTAMAAGIVIAFVAIRRGRRRARTAPG